MKTIDEINRDLNVAKTLITWAIVLVTLSGTLLLVSLLCK